MNDCGELRRQIVSLDVANETKILYRYLSIVYSVTEPSCIVLYALYSKLVVEVYNVPTSSFPFLLPLPLAGTLVTSGTRDACFRSRSDEWQGNWIKDDVENLTQGSTSQLPYPHRLLLYEMLWDWKLWIVEVKTKISIFFKLKVLFFDFSIFWLFEFSISRFFNLSIFRFFDSIFSSISRSFEFSIFRIYDFFILLFFQFFDLSLARILDFSIFWFL